MNFPNTPYQAIPDPLPPPPQDSPGAFCLTVDGKLIPYLLAAVKVLAIDRTWISESFRATGEARNLISAIMSARPCPEIGIDGLEVEDCMGCCFRVQDGHLQAFSCGEWQDIPGGDLIALIAANSGAPSSEGEIPPDETSSACFEVPAQGYTPYPASVGPGYRVEVTELSGNWSDGADDAFGIFDWYCGDGAASLLGACAGAKHTDGGDPLPIAAHMCLIAKITPDIILDLSNGPVIIPSTATGDVLQLQANDGDTSDNTGSIHVCLKITNSSARSASLLLDTGFSTAVTTPFTAVPGKTYKITVSGRGVVGAGPTSFDAFYYDVSGSPVRATTVGSFCGFTNVLELTVDGHQFTPIPAFDASDVYVLYLVGTGSPFSFLYCDSDYSDNNGTLQIDVEELAGP